MTNRWQIVAWPRTLFALLGMLGIAAVARADQGPANASPMIPAWREQAELATWPAPAFVRGQVLAAGVRGGRSSMGSALAIIGATAVVAAVIAAAAVEQNEPAGRAIATGAGVATGAALGLGVLGLLSVHVIDVSPAGFIAGGLAGATAGGLGAYALSASSRARVPVTAAGLVLPYIITVTIILGP